MSISVFGPINTGTASGGAGTATANATSGQMAIGIIVGALVRYNDSPPATTDLTIATAGTALPAYNLLVLTNANTDGLFPLAHTAYENDGTAASAEQAPPAHDKVTVTIAQANDGDSADVWLLIDNKVTHGY